MYKDKKILVLGASSFVGQHLVRRLGHDNVIGTYCSRPMDRGLYFDVLTMNLSEVVLDAQEISVAILLLGDTDPDNCVNYPKHSYDLNVQGLNKIIRWLASAEVPIIFTSSHFVFDGEKGNYVETDEALPILVYGRQKLEVESIIQQATAKYAILRLDKVYGLEIEDNTLFSNMLKAVSKGRLIRSAIDQRFSPVYVGDVVDAITATIDRNLTGIYHVAGPSCQTRFEFLQLVLENCKEYLDINTVIEPCSINEFNLPEKRPLDVSMRSDKLINATGLRPLSPALACKQLCGRLLGEH